MPTNDPFSGVASLADSGSQTSVAPLSEKDPFEGLATSVAKDPFEGHAKQVGQPEVPKGQYDWSSLGAQTKKELPGYLFLPNGVTVNQNNNKVWVPSQKQWFTPLPDGSISPDSNQIIPPTTQAMRDELASANEVGRHIVSPTRLPEPQQANGGMLPSHGPTASHEPSGLVQRGMKYLFGTDQSAGLGDLDPRAIAGNLVSGGEHAVSGIAGFTAKRFDDLTQLLGKTMPSTGIARLVAKEVFPNLDKESGAKKVLEQVESYTKAMAQQSQGWAPKGYQPGIVGDITRMGAPLAVSIANPAAGALAFGAPMGNEAEEQAKAAGASPASQKVMGLGGALAGGIVGAFGTGSGALEHVAPTIAERLASSAKSANIGGAVTLAMNALEKLAYNPDKKLLDGVDDNALTLAIIGFAHASGNPVTEEQATNLARFARENPEAFAKRYGGIVAKVEEPSPTQSPEALPNPEPARTRESVLKEAKQALESGDNEKALQLRMEAKSLAPTQEPLPGSAVREGEVPLSLTSNHPSTDSTGSPIHTTPEGVNNFWENFKDSKVVNEKGEPILLFHGGKGDFDTFDPERFGGGTDQGAHGQGIYATEFPEYASGYAERNGGAESGGNVKPVYYDLKNPFEIPSREGKTRDQWRDEYDQKLKDAGVTDLNNPRSVTDGLKKAGYDGLIQKRIDPTTGENRVFGAVAFDPSQVKSAVGNTGEFSRDNPSMLHAGLNPFEAVRDAAEAAKKELGLPEGATDMDLAKEVMGRIGRLGSTVKETVIRIMSKVKGITRDVANAIAEHLHQAVSGSKESQLGAVGPDIKAQKAAHRQEFADMLKEFYPSDSPEDVAARHAAWSKYRYTEPAQAKAQEPVQAEPEPKATQEPYDRAKGFVKGITQPIRDLGGVAKAMSSGSNEATNRVVNELNRREVLPKPYEKGSLEVPKLVRPVIFGEQKPSVIKDLPRDVHGKGFVNTFQHYMESPHNTEEPVFGAGKTPTQDAQMAIVSMVHNMNNMGKMFRDVLRTTNIEDNSAEMQAVAKPLFDKFAKAAAKLDHLRAQRGALEKAVEKATKKGTGIDEAKSALNDWDAKNGDALKQATSEMGTINDAHQAMLRDFASKYGDARVALAAEYAPDKVPDWIKLSPDEQVATAKFREAMKAYKDRMDKLGIPTLEGNYATHLTKFLAEDTGSPQERRTPREVLSFAHREEGSSQWLPSAHAAAADYVPNASRKIAMQEFYNKWRPMIDPKNMDGLANPASPNYAPNASKYLTEMFKALDSPDAHDFIDKVFNRLRSYENAKLLFGSIRAAWKHFGGKLPSLLAQNDVWTAPGALGQVKALVGKLSADSPIRKAIDNLGGNTVDWAKKAQLVSYFANTREILGMLRENPFTSAVEEARRYGVGNAKTNKMFVKMFGNKAPDVLANVRHGIQTVSSNPVALTEAWENGLDLLSSIEKAHGHGMSPQESIPAFLNNILDFNFRGGADSPLIIKDQRTRNWVQFVQTPIKLAELKAKLIRNAWNGGEDLYGTDHTANLVKHVVMTGIALAAAKKAGVNLVDSILHLPFVNADQGGRLVRMAYFGAKMNILNDPDARRKFNEAKLAFIGSPQKTVVGSPIFDLAKDVNTAATTGVPGLVKQTPIFSQIKAIATGKPPEGFDSVGAYLTGERTERSKKAQEGRAIKAGALEERYQRKSEARR